MHEGTKYTPYELVFGKTARTPTSDPPVEDLINESYSEYFKLLFNRLKDTQSKAHANLPRAKEKSKKYYNKKVNVKNFNVHDKIFLLKEPSNKLGNQYTGPYEILEIFKDKNAKIKLSNTRSKLVHQDKLKTVTSHKLYLLPNEPPLRESLKEQQREPGDDTSTSAASGSTSWQTKCQR